MKTLQNYINESLVDDAKELFIKVISEEWDENLYKKLSKKVGAFKPNNQQLFSFMKGLFNLVEKRKVDPFLNLNWIDTSNITSMYMMFKGKHVRFNMTKWNTSNVTNFSNCFADAFVLRGATAVFVDIRPDTMNIDETKIEAAITDKTKAIVPVHLFGQCADMEAIMDVHSACIDKRATNTQTLNPDAAASQGIHLEYRLKNGKTVHRIYYMNLMTDAGRVLKNYFTTPECVLGFAKEQVPEMAGYIFSFYTDGKESNIHDLEGLDLEGLLYAMVADCEAGNMAQPTGFHIPDDYDLYDKDFDPYITSVEIGWDREAMEGIDGSKEAYGLIAYKFIRIHQSCTNTLQWLEENGMLTEAMKQEMAIKFGGPTSVYTTG